MTAIFNSVSGLEFAAHGKMAGRMQDPRAVWHHVHHRVLTYGNKTVVF